MTTDPEPVSEPANPEAWWVTQLRLVLPLVLGAASFITGLITGELLWIGIGGGLIGIPGLVSALGTGGSRSSTASSSR